MARMNKDAVSLQCLVKNSNTLTSFPAIYFQISHPAIMSNSGVLMPYVFLPIFIVMDITIVLMKVMKPIAQQSLVPTISSYVRKVVEMESQNV